MGEATTELPLRTGKGRCSKCSSKGEPPFVFLGIGILMCWDCIEVIDAWSEDPAYHSEESKDSDSVEVIREI
jgi:late competence protein required for DNA uptake (superfamily II DNA/RNA helicase)